MAVVEGARTIVNEVPDALDDRLGLRRGEELLDVRRVEGVLRQVDGADDERFAFESSATKAAANW